MAKITALPLEETPDGSETVVLVKGGATKRATLSNLVDPIMAPHIATITDAFSVPAKNLANPALIRRGKRYSPGETGVVTATGSRSLGFIPLEDGKTYTVSGIETGRTAYVGPDDAEAGAMTQVGTATRGDPFTFTATAPNLFLWVHLTNAGQNDTSFDATVQVEEGSAATAYEPFRLIIAEDAVAGMGAKINAADVLELRSHNLINPSTVDHTRRYSVGTHSLTANTGFNISVTERIPVEEGQWYNASGPGAYLTGGVLRGGLFVGAAAIAVEDIASEPAQSGNGHSFFVPEGLGITHLILNLNKTADVAAGAVSPAGAGMAGGGLQLSVHIHQQPGENAEALADRVIRLIEQKTATASRRSYEDRD